MVRPVKRAALPATLLPLWLAACAGPGVVPGGDVPVDERSTPAPAEEEAPAAGVENRTVIALLDNAEALREDGRHDRAAAILERALGLDPKNAGLWSRLAAVRHDQGNWQQARVLAQRSNALARGDRQLLLANWRLIEAASVELGDGETALEARAVLRQLESR